MRLLRIIIALAMLCGPCSPHSYAGPLKRWKAARAARHTPASATPYCGPDGCDPATLSIPPGFQALTPLASQQAVQPQVAVSAPGVNVQVPLAQSVAAPSPPDAPPSTPAVQPSAPAVTTTVESQDARAARLIDALAAKFGVEDEVDPPPARKLIDDLPTVTVSVAYPENTLSTELDVTEWVRIQLGAE